MERLDVTNAVGDGSCEPSAVRHLSQCSGQGHTRDSSAGCCASIVCVLACSRKGQQQERAGRQESTVGFKLESVTAKGVYTSCHQVAERDSCCSSTAQGDVLVL